MPGRWLQRLMGLASSDPGEERKPADALLNPRSLRLAELSDLPKSTGRQAEPGGAHRGTLGCTCNPPGGGGRPQGWGGGRQAPPRAQEGAGKLSAARPSDRPKTPGGASGGAEPAPAPRASQAHGHPASEPPRPKRPLTCPLSSCSTDAGVAGADAEAAVADEGGVEAEPSISLSPRAERRMRGTQGCLPVRTRELRPVAGSGVRGGTERSRHVRERGVDTQDVTAARLWRRE